MCIITYYTLNWLIKYSITTSTILLLLLLLYYPPTGIQFSKRLDTDETQAAALNTMSEQRSLPAQAY